MLGLFPLTSRGTVIASGELQLPEVKAGESARIAAPKALHAFKSCNEVYLTILVKLKSQTLWASSDHEVAWSQHRIQSSTPAAPTTILNKLPSRIQVSTTDTAIVVSGLDFSFEFDRARGTLKQWTRREVPLIEGDAAGGMSPSFWRPATDNDTWGSLKYWERFGVDQLTSQLRSLATDTSRANEVVIKAHTFHTPPVLAWGWHCEADYIITATGSLQTNVKLTPTGSMPEHIPRIGLNLRLNKSLNQAKWFGRGPGESYPDKKASQKVGVWAVDSVRDLDVPYDVPQENGNRMDTRWVKLLRSEAHSSGIMARRTDESVFSFAASHYAADTIQKATHPPDLAEDDATLLRLDVDVAGVGTGACGPAVREDLMVRCEKVSFGFSLEPID